MEIDQRCMGVVSAWRISFVRGQKDRVVGKGMGDHRGALPVILSPLLEDSSSCLHSQDLMCVVRLLGSSSGLSRNRKPAGNANVYLTGGLINHQSPPSPFSPNTVKHFLSE